MKKNNYSFLIIIVMPMIAFILSILLLGLIKQTLDTLAGPGSNNNIVTPDLYQLPHQPVPTVHPKTERSTYNQARSQAIPLSTIKPSLWVFVDIPARAQKAPGEHEPGAEQGQDSLIWALS